MPVDRSRSRQEALPRLGRLHRVAEGEAGPSDYAALAALSPQNRRGAYSVRHVAHHYKTCVVFLLGYPGVGKRTVGSHLAGMLEGVLVDNQLINIPLLTLFKWDGKFLLPPEIWERVKPIREAVLGTIEDLAPKSNSYVFTNMLEDGEDAASDYNRIRSLAQRRGSLFMSVMLDCDVDEQVRRIDTPDRIARIKGSDPEGYRRYRHHTKLFQPPPEEVLHLDTTSIDGRQNAETIYETLISRGLQRPST